MDDHRHREGGKGDDLLGGAGEEGVDDRVRDAHQLHIEEHRQEENGDLPLGEERRRFSARPVHRKTCRSSATVSTRWVGVQPPSSPKPQVQKQTSSPAACPEIRSV